jgi:hypothetical protein
VLFSYTFFLRGFTGLAVTILSIVTLFVVMQLTGRTNWDEVFRKVAVERTGPRRAPKDKHDG